MEKSALALSINGSLKEVRKRISVKPIYAKRASAPKVELLLFSPNHNFENIHTKQGYRINPAKVALKEESSSLIENIKSL